MSPSESDLRAALHDGEGDGLNVDQLVRHARAHVAQRRARTLSAAAVVAVVTGVGVGLALAGGEGTGSSQSDAGGAAQRPDTAAQNGSMNYAPARGAPSRVTSQADDSAHAGAAHGVPPCPTELPEYTVGRDGAAGTQAAAPLFRTTVSSVVVCAYGNGTPAAGHPARLELSDGAATRLAASLENASKTKTPIGCLGPSSAHAFVVIGVSETGKRAGTVSAQLSECGGTVTNGTAVRYDWSPPQDLRKRLEALAARR